MAIEIPNGDINFYRGSYTTTVAPILDTGGYWYLNTDELGRKVVYASKHPIKRPKPKNIKWL